MRSPRARAAAPARRRASGSARRESPAGCRRTARRRDERSRLMRPWTISVAAHDARAADVREPLVAEADAEHRDLVAGPAPRGRCRGRARARAGRGPARRRSGPSGWAASSLQSISSLRTTTGSSPATLREQLVEVERVRVVVVDQQRRHDGTQGRPRQADYRASAATMSLVDTQPSCAGPTASCAPRERAGGPLLAADSWLVDEGCERARRTRTGRASAARAAQLGVEPDELAAFRAAVDARRCRARGRWFPRVELTGDGLALRLRPRAAGAGARGARASSAAPGDPRDLPAPQGPRPRRCSPGCARRRTPPAPTSCCSATTTAGCSRARSRACCGGRTTRSARRPTSTRCRA